jgi:hypothetical protein
MSWLLGIAVISWSCAGFSTSVSTQFERYSKASASHDLETLESLTGDDIVWQLGPYRLEGKEEALGPNRYDAGVQTTPVYRNVRVDGHVVEFELIESSEIIRAVGMKDLQHFPRFEFEDGLVTRKSGPWREVSPNRSMAEFNRRMVPFRQWIREVHPEAIARLVDTDRNFVFSQENGELMLSLAREWLAVGAPGRESRPIRIRLALA